MGMTWSEYKAYREKRKKEEQQKVQTEQKKNISTNANKQSNINTLKTGQFFNANNNLIQNNTNKYILKSNEDRQQEFIDRFKYPVNSSNYFMTDEERRKDTDLKRFVNNLLKKQQEKEIQAKKEQDEKVNKKIQEAKNKYPYSFSQNVTFGDSTSPVYKRKIGQEVSSYNPDKQGYISYPSESKYYDKLYGKSTPGISTQEILNKKQRVNKEELKKNKPLWEQIQYITGKKDPEFNTGSESLVKYIEPSEAQNLTSNVDTEAQIKSEIFNKIMKEGTTEEKIGAILAHHGNAIAGGAYQTGAGLANVGTTTTAGLVKLASNFADEKQKKKLDRLYRDIVEEGKEINKEGTYFNRINSGIDNELIKATSGAVNTASNVATNAMIGQATGGGSLVQAFQVAGSSAQEVLNEDENAIGRAIITGTLKGTLAKKTEDMFDANILTRGETSSIQKLVNQQIAQKIETEAGRNLASKLAGVVGENIEEFVEDEADNLIDLIINNKDYPSIEEWTKNAGETVKATTLSTLLLDMIGLGGGSDVEIENMAQELRQQKVSEKDIQKAKEFVQTVEQENLKQQNQETTQQANKDINQETKTSQNGFSETEKTETLRQEAREKLESIKQNYDENSYNQMQEFIETAPSEKALNQVINDLNKETETKQVAPLKQKQEVQLPMKQQETQNKSFEDVAFEAMSNYESNEVESPLKNRDMDSIGKQTKVNAYQYDNPKVKPYFQEMAQQMGEDLAYISSSDNRSTQKGGGTKLSATTKAMDILHNEQGYSYNQIAQGLQNIIDDKGSENNAISKKIELVIDEQLRNGYTNALGKFVEPNQEYINNITEQYSLAEQAPQNNFKYEKTDNQKVNTLYESTSKYFDDSEKTHNMLKPMEKIIRDKGYNITFDDTLDDNVNGRIRTNENGETEITINPNSNRKGEFIIGHELTHAIETQEMVDLVKKRMEKDGELRNAVEDLKKLYGTDDINGEVLADISGQLFGNQEFINNLSVEKPSVFKRIYDAIVSLANKITGNSNEALFLKDLKNKWERAYRDNTNKISEAQYSKNATNLPEVKEGYTRLYRGLESEYNPQYDKNKLDNVNGYESWTDDYDLAKSYGNNVYYIDIPTSEIKNSIIDEDSTSETYGDRNLIYKNDKPVGINGKNGNEYMLYTEHDNYKNIKYNKTNNQATAQDNQGNKLNPNMQKWASESKAKVNSQGKISDNGDLAVVYHTTTDKVAQFNEFNPVGTPYYRFGNQVVNYFTDSKDMSGSYSNNKYKTADTKRLNNINEANDYLKGLNDSRWNDNKYYIENKGNSYYLKENSLIGQEALDFLNGLSSNEIKQLRDNIFVNEEFKNTPYGKAFSWNEFDKGLQEKYHNLTNKYLGSDNLIDIQKRMIEYLENPESYNKDKDSYINKYDNEEQLLRNLKQDIQKKDWTNNSNIQYEGYVNITNPYIIDAEGKNWDSVVSKLNKDIEKNISEIKSDTKKVTDLINLQLESEKKYNQYNQNNLHEEYLLQARLVKDLERGLPLDVRNDIEDTYLFGFNFDDYATKTTKNKVEGKNLVKDLLTKYAEEHDANDIREFNTKIEKYGNLTLNEFLKQAHEAYNTDMKYGKEDAYFKSEVEKILNRDITKAFNDDFITGEQLYKLAKEGFSKNAVLDILGERQTTNDIVKQVIEMNKNGANYDGVIMKNVVDYGGNSQTRKPANLYVTFNSNQFKAIDNENPTSDPDIRYSKQSGKWQDYLENHFKSEGTKTDLRDIRLPMKEKQEVRLPMKENIQQTQDNTQNTKGEAINWTEIERPEENRKFRKHYKSIIESDNTTAEAKSIAKDLMGTDTYVPETNKGQLAQADQRIMTSSPEVELQSLLSRSMNGEKISSVDIAVGERLIQYFSKTGSKQQLQEAIQATAMAGTSAGQTVQALSMLNHQTPQGQATWIQRSVDKMNKELAKKKGGTITTDADGNLQVINKQGKDITNKVDLFNLTPEMIDKIMNSENQEQMYKNIDEVYEELGQQVPKSMIEKIDTWRYFSMLANARTHIRNMVGNVAMGKMQRVKDKIAGGIEGVVSQFNPNMERTKTLARADKKTKNFAKQDFKNMEVQSRLELNENKYNPQSRLQNARRTFKSDVMENTLGRLFNLNDKLLSAEDGIGLKAGYQKALADYITANKIDVDNITDAQLNKARNYAVQQAKEATFHQANAIASAVAQFENKNLATKLFTGAVLPFKKTPMNVAKAGMEYSPLQIAKSATVDLVNLRKGNISVNQYIDNLSKGMTGTGIALVGYALANAGILKASGGDDKDKEKYEEEQGKQSYSIQIAGKTYSLDWLAPTGIPLFIGAETHKLFNQEETEKSTEKKSEEDRLNQAIKGASNLLNAGATAINPMSEMSMISGLTSALSSYNTSDNLGSLGNIMTNAGKSYVNQFFPTLMGQVAKTTDKYERTTKSTATGTIGKAVDQTINQIKNKIPGLRQTLPIKTDIWGKELKQEVNLPLRAVNNFINPATVKNVSTDKVDMELNKLYEENHSSSLLPDILTKTVQLNKQTYRLSNKEYAEFTKNYGQTSHKLIENFIKTSDYNKLTQEQKETAISNIYSYAKEQNKMDYAKKVNETVKPSTLYTTMKEIEKNGGKQSEYLSYLAKTKGMSKESEKNKVLADSNYSNRTKEIIYTNGTGKDDNLYNNLLSKSHINMTEYLDYKDKVSNKVFSADKDKNGKTVTGSAKAKVINYLNNNITGVGNRLLIAGKSYALQNNERQKLAQYINSIANTREERIEIYKQLDKNFYVRNGKVYMRVSK